MAELNPHNELLINIAKEKFYSYPHEWQDKERREIVKMLFFLKLTEAANELKDEL